MNLINKTAIKKKVKTFDMRIYNKALDLIEQEIQTLVNDSITEALLDKKSNSVLDRHVRKVLRKN